MCLSYPRVRWVVCSKLVRVRALTLGRPELGEVQKALNIVAEGCFVLSVKNPEALPYSTYSATLPTKPVPPADTDQGIPLPALDDRRAVQQVRPPHMRTQDHADSPFVARQMIHDQPGLPRRDPSTVPQSPLRIEFPPHLQAAFQGNAPVLRHEVSHSNASCLQGRGSQQLCRSRCSTRRGSRSC
jgi:hypothetical protein